jgi:hypothetical protein
MSHALCDRAYYTYNMGKYSYVAVSKTKNCLGFTRSRGYICVDAFFANILSASVIYEVTNASTS